MRSYGQYCPVAHGAEIFADRWTALIVRELDLGASRYNEIRRGLPGISRTLLANRLRQLERDGVVQRSDGAYRLTEAGHALVQVVDALGRWGARHSIGEPRRDELDAALLLWWMHRRIAFERVPEQRVTVRFRFRQGQRRVFWLVLEGRECSVCLTDPGYEVTSTSTPISPPSTRSGSVGGRSPPRWPPARCGSRAGRSSSAPSRAGSS